MQDVHIATIACEGVCPLPAQILRRGMQRRLGPGEDSSARWRYAVFAVWSAARPGESRNEGRSADATMAIETNLQSLPIRADIAALSAHRPAIQPTAGVAAARCML